MRTAIITGASGGIGMELAKLAAADGFRLVLIARNTIKLNEIASELTAKYQIRVDVFPADLSKREEVHRFIEHADSSDYDVEMLINNAGFGDYSLFEQEPVERIDDMLMLNIHALTMLSRHFLPDMLKKQRAYILNVASLAAFMPGPLMAVYYATKSYVLSLSQAVSCEVSGSGVRVTVLCPGPTLTGFEEAANLSGSRLFKVMKPVSAKSVALYGYKSLLRGKRLAVHGLSNKLMVFSLRFMPRKLVTAVVKIISSKV